MKKDLKDKLNVDSINWAEVILGLDGKTTFKDHDIKRALRKTGRSFNNNGPFHNVVKTFIEVLGTTVSSKMVSGEVIYTLTSTEAALKKVGHKSTKQKTPIKKCNKLGMGVGLAAGIAATIDTHKKGIKKTITISDEDKIKDLFKRSYTSLEHAIYILAIYVKHAKTKLSGNIIKTELTNLGVNFFTFKKSSRNVISEIFQKLGFNPLVATKGHYSTWSINGPKDILDEYTHLTEIYEKLTGQKSKNLDDYMMTASEIETPKSERRPEILKEIMKKQKKTPIISLRPEKDKEIMWKKWLLISSSKNSLGANRSVTNLVSWIKSNRNYEISEEEAKKLYYELMCDSEKELKYEPSGYVTMTNHGWETLSKFYSPKQFKETILVKLPVSLEIASSKFSGLTFKFDDTTTSGMYLYTVDLDRSMSCEISLKKLLRFIQISGTLYTLDSWMVERVQKIISKEDSEETSANVSLLSLEKDL